MRERLFHEDFNREDIPKGSTDRGFGLTVGGMCAAIGTGALWFGKATAWWWLGAGSTLIAMAVACPAALAPLNRLWMKFGLLLFQLINPVVMAVLYYFCIVPMGLIMRLYRKDPLKLRRDLAARSYWEPREPASPVSRGMKDQF